jgi:hypothetical protein
MTHKVFLLLLLFAFSITTTVAQTGSLTGSIRTSDGEAAEMVTVNIKGNCERHINR